MQTATQISSKPRKLNGGKVGKQPDFMPPKSEPGSSAIGRKDAEKQPAVIKTKEVTDKIEHLIELHNAKREASTNYGDAVKAVAEKSGYLASVVRKLVNAKAGDDFDGEARKVEQMSLIFEECGDA